MLVVLTRVLRERKSGGDVMKRLKSQLNQTDKQRPVVTEDELRVLGRDITPDEILGLCAVTRGMYGVSYRFLKQIM